MTLKPNLINFPDLSHHAFQHPLDSQATAKLAKVPGLPKVIKFISQKSVEQMLHYSNIAGKIRVSERQYPSLYKQYLRMAEVLDVRKLPSLYIETTPTINAFAAGIDNYSIVLCSGLIDIMDEDELLAILGHELGHVKCEHQLYKTTAMVLTGFGGTVLSQLSQTGIPGVEFFVSAGRLGVEFAIMDWNRKAELSCDRAALLATQDVDVVARALAKLGGFSRRYEAELDLDEVENQANLYAELGADSLFMKLLKLQSMMEATHPYPVVRVKEIRAWAKSEEYEQIIKGTYKKFTPKLTVAGWQDLTILTPRARECPNPKCKYPCDENFTFCPSCQTNVRTGLLICGKCRHPVESDWTFCMSCAHSLQVTEELPESTTKQIGSA